MWLKWKRVAALFTLMLAITLVPSICCLLPDDMNWPTYNSIWDSTKAGIWTVDQTINWTLDSNKDKNLTMGSKITYYSAAKFEKSLRPQALICMLHAGLVHVRGERKKGRGGGGK